MNLEKAKHKFEVRRILGNQYETVKKTAGNTNSRPLKKYEKAADTML